MALMSFVQCENPDSSEPLKCSRRQRWMSGTQHIVPKKEHAYSIRDTPDSLTLLPATVKISAMSLVLKAKC